ncbi:MAG: phosphate ABC transporter substrate-binding protein PstS [Candidatus Dormibacteria bacterium]
MSIARGSAAGLLIALGLGACGGSTGNVPGASGPAAGVTSAACQGTPAKPGFTDSIAEQPNAAKQLSGAGSTFISPMMSVWAEAYSKKAGVQVAYQSIGSGGGIKQVQARTVDFGASDAFMSDGEIANARGAIVQIPMVLAPVVAVYNLPGLKSGVQFDGETLGLIFAGKITKWSDPALVALNPGTTLPDLPIAVAHRSDGSGTTDIWTDYLTKTSPSWVNALGGAAQSRGKTVAWPVGIGGKGNEGVSAAVGQTQGAIGYVELGYAIQQNLTYGNVKNRAGKFIQPCIQTVTAATEGVSYPDDLRFDLTDQSGSNAYPVTGATWLLIPQVQTDASKAAALINFVSWSLSTGQDLTLGINYAPLGKELQGRAMDQLKKLTLNGSAIVK